MSSDSPLILVVEDDAVLRLVTCAALSASHYRVIEAGTGQKALAEVAAQHPDAIVLDLGLPDMDGLDVIRQLHDSPPIIVFSARGIEQDKVAAFDAGAVEFLAKPFEAADLIARVRSALHRSRKVTVFRTGDLSVDLARREVMLGGESVRLTTDEYRLLLVLVRHAGKVVTHRKLLDEVWGLDNATESLYLRVYMGQLRRKLEPDPARPRYLKTEPGVGYRLVDE